MPPESEPSVGCQTLVATGGYTITCLPSLGSLEPPFFVSPISVGFSFSPKHRNFRIWKIINCGELSSAAEDTVPWCPCSEPHHVFCSHRSVVTWHLTFYKQRHALDSYPWIGKIKSRPSVKYSSCSKIQFPRQVKCHGSDGENDTFEAKFLSVVADCDHGDQYEEDEQQAQGDPDHTGHGQALCNEESHTIHGFPHIIPFTSSWTVTMSIPRSFSALNN